MIKICAVFTQLLTIDRYGQKNESLRSLPSHLKNPYKYLYFTEYLLEVDLKCSDVVVVKNLFPAQNTDIHRMNRTLGLTGRGSY